MQHTDNCRIADADREIFELAVKVKREQKYTFATCGVCSRNWYAWDQPGACGSGPRRFTPKVRQDEAGPTALTALVSGAFGIERRSRGGHSSNWSHQLLYDLRRGQRSKIGGDVDQPVLYEFVSHIDGKNADVRIYPDRVEWVRAGKVSKGKAALGVMTAGMSLAKTGVRSSKGSSEMIPVKSLTSVTAEKDSFQMKVTLVTSGNTIEMRVSKDEATVVKDTLTHLMLGTHPSQQAAGNTADSQPPPQSAAEADDPAEALKKLAEMRDDGLISEEQFEAKRQEIVDRL